MMTKEPGLRQLLKAQGWPPKSRAWHWARKLFFGTLVVVLSVMAFFRYTGILVIGDFEKILRSRGAPCPTFHRISTRPWGEGHWSFQAKGEDVAEIVAKLRLIREDAGGRVAGYMNSQDLLPGQDCSCILDGTDVRKVDHYWSDVDRQDLALNGKKKFEYVFLYYNPANGKGCIDICRPK